MTAAELIEELKKVPSDMQVLCGTFDYTERLDVFEPVAEVVHARDGGVAFCLRERNRKEHEAWYYAKHGTAAEQAAKLAAMKASKK